MLTRPLPLVRFAAVLVALAMSGITCASGFQPQAAPGRLFRVVNGSFDSVTGMEIADASSGGYTAVDLGEPLQGGLASTTVRLPEGACDRDVRVTFRNARSAVYKNVDVCKATGLRLSPLKRLPQEAALPQGAQVAGLPAAH